ncbi:MAG: hypothetical protein NC933_00135, partial [Candidatus Omnitrophica bacterium]|nr:hypothetical protein [Candidatus Omnitrophota bacterium]
MKKLISLLVLIIFIALVAVIMAKDVIIKTSVERGVEMVTGLKITIGSFRLGLIDSSLFIKGLRLFNPAGFKDSVMAEVQEIAVIYDLPAILKGDIHLKEARLALKEFTVVRNERGILNLDAL